MSRSTKKLSILQKLPQFTRNGFGGRQLNRTDISSKHVDETIEQSHHRPTKLYQCRNHEQHQLNVICEKKLNNIVKSRSMQ